MAGLLADLVDDVLPAVDVVGGRLVLTGDGRDLAETVLGLAGTAAFVFELAGLEVGRAFCRDEGAEGAAGAQVLALLGPPAAMARLPPVLVSLNPNGLVAVPTRDPGAPVQSLIPLPEFMAASPYRLIASLILNPTPLMLVPTALARSPAKPPAVDTVFEMVG